VVDDTECAAAAPAGAASGPAYRRGGCDHAAGKIPRMPIAAFPQASEGKN